MRNKPSSTGSVHVFYELNAPGFDSYAEAGFASRGYAQILV
jgi:hypothetical protein